MCRAPALVLPDLTRISVVSSRNEIVYCVSGSDPTDDFVLTADGNGRKMKGRRRVESIRK